MSPIEVTVKCHNHEHHAHRKCPRVESLEFEITRLRKENHDLAIERSRLMTRTEWLEMKLNRAHALVHDLDSITRLQCL